MKRQRDESTDLPWLPPELGELILSFVEEDDVEALLKLACTARHRPPAIESLLLAYKFRLCDTVYMPKEGTDPMPVSNSALALRSYVRRIRASEQLDANRHRRLLQDIHHADVRTLLSVVHLATLESRLFYATRADESVDRVLFSVVPRDEPVGGISVRPTTGDEVCALLQWKMLRVIDESLATYAECNAFWEAQLEAIEENVRGLYHKIYVMTETVEKPAFLFEHCGAHLTLRAPRAEDAFSRCVVLVDGQYRHIFSEYARHFRHRCFVFPHAPHLLPLASRLFLARQRNRLTVCRRLSSQSELFGV